MIEPEKHIALVCNPTRENARALKLADQIILLLSGMNIRHSVFTTYWPMLWEGISEAWIIGGDGTLNWFINQYPDLSIPLTVFAGGTGNDFHWMLYGDMKMEQQVDLVLEATSKMVDGGSCNEKLFLNGVGIGFDGAIVKDLVGKKKLAGKASYVLSILKHIINYQERACIIDFGDDKISQDCFLISVANAKRYGGGFCVAPEATVTDNLLDVNIVGKISPVNRIRFLPVIEKGQHLALPFIQYKQVPKVTIKSSTPLHCHIDGEYVFEDEFRIEILPKRFSFLY